MKNFIPFISGFSRCAYIFLIAESSALDVLKIYKTEVENQLAKKIQVVRSDRRGEYFGRYNEGILVMDLYNLLHDWRIIAHHTVPDTPEQIGVVERKNKTLMGMIRSIMSSIIYQNSFVVKP